MTLNARIRPALVVTALLGIAACADAPEPVDGSPRVIPMLTIGAEDSLPGHQLHRVTGAARLASGSIAVGNGGSGEIRVFDPTGGLRAGFGGIGGGPGEFQHIGSLLPVGGDSLMVWDPVLQRLSVWSGEGELGGSVSIRELTAPAVAGTLPGGRLVMTVPQRAAPGQVPAWTTWEDSIEVAVLHPRQPEDVRTLGVFPDLTRVAAEAPGPRRVHALVPTATPAIVRSWRSSIFIGLPGSAEIVRFDTTGSRIGTVQLPLEPRERTDEDSEEWLRVSLQKSMQRANGAEVPGLREYLGQFPQPQTFPAFDQMVVGQDGSIWLRGYVGVADESAEWLKVSPEGDVLATLSMDTSFRITQAGSDWLLGTATGRDDRELVVLYEVATT